MGSIGATGDSGGAGSGVGVGVGSAVITHPGIEIPGSTRRGSNAHAEQEERRRYEGQLDEDKQPRRARGAPLLRRPTRRWSNTHAEQEDPTTNCHIRNKPVLCWCCCSTASSFTLARPSAVSSPGALSECASASSSPSSKNRTGLATAVAVAAAAAAAAAVITSAPPLLRRRRRRRPDWL